MQGIDAIGRVLRAGGVGTERSNTGGCVRATRRVVLECIGTVCRVAAPGCVTVHRLITVSHVVVAECIVIECPSTSGHVVVTDCVAIECLKTKCGVVESAG